MAIQFPDDQVPALKFAGAQSLARGISNAGESIRQGLDRMFEEKKRLKAQGDAAKKFLQNQKGYDKIDLGNMSSEDAISELLGLKTGQEFQKVGADIAAQEAGTAFDKQRTAGMREAIERESAFGRRSLELAGPPMQGPVMPGEPWPPTHGPITPNAMMQSALETGALSSPNVANMIEAAVRAEKLKAGDAAPFIFEDPENKSRFLIHGGTALPSVGRGSGDLEIMTEPSTGLKFRSTKNGWVPLPGQTLTRKASPVEQAQVKAATTQWNTAADLLAVESAKASPDQKKIASYNQTITNASNTLSRISAPLPPLETTDTNAAPGLPAVGTVEGGYRFKGGDPSKPESWEKVQ